MRTLRTAGVLLLIGILCLPLGVQAQILGGALRQPVGVSYNTAGDHIVVAGVANIVIRIYWFKLYCNGANNITIKDSTPTILDPTMNLSANTGFILDYQMVFPLYSTAAGKDFIVNLSANQACTVKVIYTQG